MHIEPLPAVPGWWPPHPCWHGGRRGLLSPSHGPQAWADPRAVGQAGWSPEPGVRCGLASLPGGCSQAGLPPEPQPVLRPILGVSPRRAPCRQPGQVQAVGRTPFPAPQEGGDSWRSLGWESRSRWPLSPAPVPDGPWLCRGAGAWKVTHPLTLSENVSVFGPPDHNNNSTCWRRQRPRPAHLLPHTWRVCDTPSRCCACLLPHPQGPATGLQTQRKARGGLFQGKGGAAGCGKGSRGFSPCHVLPWPWDCPWYGHGLERA